MGNGFPLENNNTSVALSSWFKIYICRRTGRKKYNKKYKVQDTKKASSHGQMSIFHGVTFYCLQQHTHFTG